MKDTTTTTEKPPVDMSGRIAVTKTLGHASEKFDAIIDLMNALVFRDIKVDTADRAIRALCIAGGTECEAAQRALGDAGTGLFEEYAKEGST